MTHQDHERDQSANLPAVADLTAVEEMIFDGEVVDEDQAAAPVAARITAVSVPPPARIAASHAVLVAAGAVVLARRWHHARTRHERMMREAEMRGDHATVLLWRQQLAAERRQQHEHRVRTAETAVLVAKATPWIFGGGLACMVSLGVLLSIASGSVAGMAWPFLAAAHAAADAVAVASELWLAASVTVPLAVAGVLHEVGRRGGDLSPGWSRAALPQSEDMGAIVTADAIVLALQNIQVKPLNDAFKSGWRPVFTLTPVRDGRGYEVEFSVPLGVTPEMIADTRPVLARNLHREEIETWPSAATMPGYVRLWVADRGAIGNAAPEWPLLHEGQADVFAGVPGGVTPRGEGALIPVVGNNGVLGGLPGQGKSNAARVVMLGCATDPLCGLDAFVFANNGDFDAFEPRLAVYRKGLDDAVIAAAVNHLQEAYEDVARREQMLADIGAKKLTRAIAERYPELRPRVSLFSECHELFGHPEYGDLAAELAVKTAKRGRKTGRVLWFDTQSSRRTAIPGALVELVSINVCFAVKSWRNNDGFLGDGSFAAGIRATELRPNRDRGTSLVTGISDSQFELLRWHFIEVDDDTGWDAATDVIARTMQHVAPGTPLAGSSQRAAIVVRDLLDDVAEVIGPDRIRLADLPARLRKLAPTWGRYLNLTGKELRDQLAAENVRTINPGNVPTLDPEQLRRALAEREVS